MPVEQFNFIKAYNDILPEDVLEYFAESDDEDVRWISKKIIGMRNWKQNRKASRIARRIVLDEMIAMRICNEKKNQ